MRPRAAIAAAARPPRNITAIDTAATRSPTAQSYGYSQPYARTYGYGQSYGYAQPYAVNTGVAAQQCSAAVQNRLYNRSSIGGILGAVLGTNTSGRCCR